MKKKRRPARRAALIISLIAALALGAAPAAADTAMADTGADTAGAESRAANTPKEEVVYGVLDASGQVGKVYVVNSFHLPKAGTIVDYGPYDEVTNLTSLEDIRRQGSKLTVAAPSGSFYYQGQMDKTPLPWQVQVDYTLDGKAIDPAKLGGASGQLTVALHITGDPDCDPYFFDNYALMVSVTLDGDKCLDITAEGGSIISAGSAKTIYFIIMAAQETEVSFSAQVSDFTMAGMQLAGISLEFGVEDIDTDEFLEDIYKLQDGIVEFDDGVVDLYSGVIELNDGVVDLFSGVSDFREGMRELSNGVWDLALNYEIFNDGLAELRDGAEDFSGGLREFRSYVRDFAQGMDDILGEDAYGQVFTYADLLASASQQFLSGISYSQEQLDAAEATVYQAGMTLKAASDAVAAKTAALMTCVGALGGAEGAYQAADAAADAAAAAAQNAWDAANEAWQAAAAAQAAIPADPMDPNFLTAMTTAAAAAAAAQVLEQTAQAAQNAADNAEYEAGQVGAAITAAQTALEAAEIEAGLAQEAVLTAQAAYEAARDAYVGMMASSTIATNYMQINTLAAGVNSGLNDSSTGLKSTLGTLADSSWLLYEGAEELEDGADQFWEGLGGAADGSGEIISGIWKLFGGAEDLTEGANELKDGVEELAEGTDELEEGVGELKDGSRDLRRETGSMDEDIDQAISDMLEEYGGRDIVPRSFASPENVNVDSVQFVMQTAAILAPDEDEKAAEDNAGLPADPQAEEDSQQTPWERFLALGGQWTENLDRAIRLATALNDLFSRIISG